MSIFKNMNLYVKTSVIISVMLIIIMIIFISFTIIYTGQALKTSIEGEFASISKSNSLQVQEVLDATELTSKSIESYIDKVELEDNFYPEDIGKRNSIIYNTPISSLDFETEKYITRSARNAVKNNPDVIGVGVMFEPYKFDKNIESYAFYIAEDDEEGDIRPFGEYSFYSKEIYYKDAREKKEMVFTAPFEYKGIEMVTAALPIIYKGEVKGVIMTDFNVSNFSKIDTLNERYPSMYSAVYNQDGIIVYDSEDIDTIGKNISDFYTNKEDMNYIQKSFKKGKGFSLETTREDGRSVTCFFNPIKAANTNWWSLTAVNTNDMNQAILTTTFWLIVLCVIALILIVTTILIVLKKMLNPIQNVAKAATEIARGNFDVDVEVTSNDEIGQLSTSFVEMAQDINSFQQQLVIKNEQLEETIEKLKKSDATNSAINVFVANISHEFRTPITLILSTIQLFEMNLDCSVNEEKHLKYIKIMKQNCYRLLRLVNNLIDISRIEAGYMQLNLKNVNIVKVVSEIVMSVYEYAEDKDIFLEFVSNENEIIAAIDPDKMERILLNLLSNAIKFTPADGEIIAGIKREGKYIIISVKDTGMGIPKENIDLIFDRFHQVNNSLARLNEGSGIGLSLVKSFTEMHGGTVTVNSELGKGSEFVIKIPLISLDDDKYNLRGNDNIEKYEIEFSDIY